MRLHVRNAVAIVAIGLLLGACGTRGTTSTGSAGASATSSTSSAAPTSSTSSTAPAPAGLSISPPRGLATTTFAVAFTAPQATGAVNAARIGYTVSVSGSGAGGCLTERSLEAGATTAGQRVTVALDPAKLGGRWCAGEHAVRVIEVQSPVCQPGTMCPQYVRVIATVGVARFAVDP